MNKFVCIIIIAFSLSVFAQEPVNKSVVPAEITYKSFDYEKGDLAALKTLKLDNPRQLNFALKKSASSGKKDFINFLISKGADNFNSAMADAAYGGHTDIVKLMIAKGADNFNWTMAYAAEGGHIDIVKLMIENGADNFNDIMQRAARGGHIDIVKLMIENGADDFVIVMLWAAYGGHTDIVKLMIENGADIDLESPVFAKVFKILHSELQDKKSKNNFKIILNNLHKKKLAQKYNLSYRLISAMAHHQGQVDENKNNIFRTHDFFKPIPVNESIATVKVYNAYKSINNINDEDAALKKAAFLQLLLENDDYLKQSSIVGRSGLNDGLFDKLRRNDPIEFFPLLLSALSAVENIGAPQKQWLKSYLVSELSKLNKDKAYEYVSGVVINSPLVASQESLNLLLESLKNIGISDNEITKLKTAHKAELAKKLDSRSYNSVKAKALQHMKKKDANSYDDTLTAMFERNTYLEYLEKGTGSITNVSSNISESFCSNNMLADFLKRVRPKLKQIANDETDKEKGSRAFEIINALDRTKCTVLESYDLPAIKSH